MSPSSFVLAVPEFLAGTPKLPFSRKESQVIAVIVLSVSG
jgi:hypothetical protein